MIVTHRAVGVGTNINLFSYYSVILVLVMQHVVNSPSDIIITELALKQTS